MPNNIRPQSTEKSSGENVFAEQGNPGYNGIIMPNAEAKSEGQRGKRILLGGKLWSEAPDTGEQGRGPVEGAGGANTFEIEKIRPELKTNSDTAFFWSGRTDGVGGAKIAADIAKREGGVTLETTIYSKKIVMPEWDFSKPSSMDAWDLASGAYAEQVSGEIRAVVGSELRPGNIWEDKELPRLKANPNVTKITTVDPRTGIEKIIFEM